MDGFNPSKLKNFSNKTLLAMDYGSKVAGIAIFRVGADPYPTPYGRIIFKSDEQVANELKTLLDDECVDHFILGLPTYEDGNESQMTKNVKVFAEKFQKLYPSFPLTFQDETYSSYEAEKRMLSSPQYNFKVDPKQIDAVAACIILEDFLKS